MSKDIYNYSILFEQALCQIKSIRDPRANRPETADLRWNDVASQVIINFEESNLRKFFNISQAADKISIFCLCLIIIQLLKKYEYPIQIIDIKDAKGLAKAYLYVLDKKTSTLLMFKELEECAVWKRKEFEPKEIQDIMDSCGANSCKYIYFVYDNAYLQIIGHNDDEDDPGRGYNLFSLKWFFEAYFGVDEYTRFKKALETYIQDIKNCIGYQTIKTLTPGSLVNFRKISENQILKYPYMKLTNKQVKEYNLNIDELHKLEEQFFKYKTFLGLLGSKDYAESFVTAEWLFDSMKKAQAIDLTIIGMGYFKATEQLLYELICLHKNEGRKIRKDCSRKELPPTVELNDVYIEDNAIDTTIGSMAVFCKKNLDIFREDLTFQTKSYILETIFNYKDLRNGFFHKENVHDWSIIENIRDSTFELMFLLLGAKVLVKDYQTQLGFPEEIYSDYYKLCEYVNYHHGDLFYLALKRDEEKLVSGYADIQSKVINDRYIRFSGVYFKELGDSNKISRFTEDDLPSRISLGKFVLGYTDKIEMIPMKVKVVFENGKFVGPSIAEEEKLDY